MCMKKYTVEIQAGDLIEVGRFRNVQAKVKSIEIDENQQPVIVTSRGRKKLFTFRLSKLYKTPKQILMERKR